MDGNASDRLVQQLVHEKDPIRRLELIEHALRPPEPQLLDTCVIQNLDWIDRQTTTNHIATKRENCHQKLAKRYGNELADDLIDLQNLYNQFQNRSGYPWLVCEVAYKETGLLTGQKGSGIIQMIEFLEGHQSDCGHNTYPGVAIGALLNGRDARVSPLILRALGVKSVDEISSASGPLSFLPDSGDRLVVTFGLLSNVPAILTTDRKTFWAERSRILELGIEVIRPTELLAQYEQYWEMLDAEFAKRKHDS